MPAYGAKEMANAFRTVRRNTTADLHVMELKTTSRPARLAHEHLDDRSLITRTKIRERLIVRHAVTAHVMKVLPPCIAFS